MLDNSLEDYVIMNAEWLKHYDDSVEINALKSIIQEIGVSRSDELQIADVGCGSGRLIPLVRTLFPKSYIYAVDKNKESINYALGNNIFANVNYFLEDAFSFLNKPEYHGFFDLVYFSWSLFDMTASLDTSLKVKELGRLISLTKNALRKGGCIIVTQPTKGGIFEKFLSKLMPSSDADYYLTHECLIDNGFVGPPNPIPTEKDSYCYWSNFVCTEAQLYLGVSSVLMLETGKTIDFDEFEEVFLKLLASNRLQKQATYSLSDCVNVYYWKSKQ